MSSDANSSTSQGSVRTSARLHAHQPVSRRRRYVKAALILLCAMFAGWVIGVSSTVLYFKNKFDKNRKRPTTQEISDGIVERMEKSVQMSASERQKIDEIIQSHFAEVDRVRKESFNVLWDELDKMNAGIAEVLGPERNQKWEDDKDKHFGEKRRQYERRRKEAQHSPGHSRGPLHDPPSL